MEEEHNHKNDDKKMILKSNHEKRIDSFKSQESDKNLNQENHIPLQDEVGVVTLEEAFEIVKGNQLSQWFYGLTLGLSFSFCGMFAYSFAFQSKYPDFECKSRQHPNWYPCTREDVCQNSEDIAGFKYRYNTDSAYTINNWITSMNIECVPEYQIGLFGSLYFIGVCIGAGTLLRLADIRGRKPVLLFSLALNMLITFLLCITNDLFITYLLVILNGIVIAPRVSISYLYMMEVIQENKKKLFNFISCICDAFSVIFIAAYFYFIKSGISIFYIYIVYGTITLIILFFIPESPHYLYAKCRFNELRECFNNYAKMNNTQPLILKFNKEVKQSESKAEDHSLKGLVSDRSRFINLIIMTVNWCVCSFCYYELSFFVKYFKGDIFTNCMTIGAADALAVTVVRLGQIYISTKKGFIFSFMVVFVVSIIYLIVQNILTFVPICVLLMRLGITTAFTLAYFGNSEYFPAEFMSTVFGVCNIFARTSTIFAPMVAEILSQPILLITALTITSSFCSILLRPPEKIGDFSHSGNNGKILFVPDLAINELEFNVDQNQKSAKEMDDINKELFVIDDEEDEDFGENIQNNNMHANIMKVNGNSDGHNNIVNNHTSDHSQKMDSFNKNDKNNLSFSDSNQN